MEITCVRVFFSKFTCVCKAFFVSCHVYGYYVFNHTLGNYRMDEIIIMVTF